MTEEVGRKRGRKPKLKKRTKEQKDYDIAFCTNLFLKGYTYQEIAVRLNQDLARREMDYTITFQQVGYDIKNCLIEWKRERLDDINDYVTAELRKLDKMEVEVWEAWEKSKIRKRNKTKTGKAANGKESGYEENAIEETPGNPRYLDLLLNIQQRRAKLLGYDAPVKVEIPGIERAIDDDKPKYDISIISDDLLFKVADQLQKGEFERIKKEKSNNDE